MFLLAGIQTGLELLEVALVSQVEMRPRDEDGRLHLALGHILDSSGKIVVVALVLATVGRVGEVGWVQLESGDGNSVDGVSPSPGEV